jgi:hypothetical protein
VRITVTNSVATGEENRRARRAAVGAMAGTSLEFYDFYVYATASALVFGKVFFPETGNPFIGTLASFGVFGVGFAHPSPNHRPNRGASRRSSPYARSAA